MTPDKSNILPLAIGLCLIMNASSCGGGEDAACSGASIEYDGDLHGDYYRLYEVVRGCVGEYRGMDLVSEAPKLRCLYAVSCSERTDNNCILPGVAGRYCVDEETILIPCYYNELQGDNTIALRLIRHEMIHHLGYERDYSHSSPVWGECDTQAIIEESMYNFGNKP